MERLERFKGLGAGKRQAWTPIRSHGCGLGTPVGCEGLADGTLDRPEEAMDLALGSLLPALEACLGACGALGWFLRDGSGLGVAVACAGSRPWDAVGCEGLAAWRTALGTALKKRWIWPWGRCGLRWRQALGRLVVEGCKGFDVLGVWRVWRV